MGARAAYIVFRVRREVATKGMHNTQAPRGSRVAGQDG